MLRRLDAAFFGVAEARGGAMLKFYVRETMSVEVLRKDLERYGLDVGRLEAEGRFRFVEEVDPLGGRAQFLGRLRDEQARDNRVVWASFDWVRGVGVEGAFRQQERLAELIDADDLVVLTKVLERVMDDCPLATQRRAKHSYTGAI